MLSKKETIEAINAVPDDQFSNIDNIIAELILLEKIDKGIQAMDAGEVLSEKELDREIEKW
jgi:hypothetical protein